MQKRTSVNFFFKVSTLSPNIFAPYIKNLGMCFEILVYFDFGYVSKIKLAEVENSCNLEEAEEEEEEVRKLLSCPFLDIFPL